MEVIVISVGLIFAYILFCFFKAYAFCYKLSHPKRVDETIISSCPLSYKKFDVKTSDNRNLKCVEYKPKCKIKGTIVVCHYLGGNKERILLLVDFLIKAGYKILSFDFRNHGESDNCHNIRFSLEHDFKAFYAAVKDNLELPAGIIGFSMGSTPAIDAIANKSIFKALVIDSGPLIFTKSYFKYVLNDKLIRNPLIRFFFLILFLEYGRFQKMSKNTIENLKKINIPVFFIHGEKDHILPIKNTELAIDQINHKDVFLWKVKASRHLTNKFLRNNEYEKKILNFFDQMLIKDN